MVSRRVLALLFICLLVAASSAPLPAQQSPAVSPSLFAEMRWRPIGPTRGGRTRSAAGHPSQPYTFYIGVCNGGVWKTTDAGRTWKPIFDDQETGSIGAVVVAPSNPNVIYVGSGEGLARPDLSVGDGVFKSTDAGQTWTHLPGLRDAQQIPNIAVDPRNADRLFVAVAGHPYGPNKERGIYRSTDGGRTFQPVLQKDENVGGADVDIDPLDPNIVLATLWEERQGPWENAQWRGTGAGIYKSTDGGTTWRPLTKGLPGDGAITQANLAIAPSNPRRLYAAIAVGAGTSFSKSDDGGETWTAANSRGVGRIGGGDLSVPIVNPKDADMVITANTVSYKSTDAGQTWVPFKGAPGGDDYQGAWINPNDPNIMLLVSDQGAVVTLNGGQSWSSWYNQPTAQLYHVNADNDFPYRVCSGQQESGSACVSSRGNGGQITFRDWHPASGVVEYGYAVPDPLNPNIVYGSGVTRYDRTTGQFSSVGPGGGRGGGGGGGRGGGGAAAGPAQRTTRTVPLAFSGADPRAMYFGGGQVWKTSNGGRDWTSISPNFTRKTWDPPKTFAKYAAVTPPPPQLAAIYAIAPSPLDPLRLWVGTDDGMIQTTGNGGTTWTDVTPPTMTPFMKVFNMDAGHFDALTAYAAGNTLRTDDMRPHLFRTHDGGKTWVEINTGLENAGPTSTIREDPKQKGLLYAGSERHVYVSFDDGDHWQTLKLNMASSSVRDLTVKDDDLIAATHGRGFWILDNVTPLRQISAASANDAAILFKPAAAWRVRWNTNSDTPLPPDEPNMPNPPEGASIDYYLKSAASGPVVLEVLTTDGKLVRRYSSADPVTPLPDPTASSLPLYWYRPPQGLSAAPGMHRFPWDVHYQPLGGGAGGGRAGGLPIAAVPFNTVNPPSTPWVNPGTYAVKLTVDGKSYTQPITVKQDPRVKTPALVMQTIYADTKAAYFGAIDAQDAARQAQGLRDQIAAIAPKPTGAVADALAAFDTKVLALIGAAPAGGAGGRGAGLGAGGARGGGAAGGGAAGAGAAGGGAAAGVTLPVIVQGPAGAAPGAPVPPAAAVTLSGASTALSGVMNSMQAADVEPTANQVAAMALAKKTAATAMAAWTTIKTVDLAALNLKLKAAGIGALKVQ